MSPDGEARYRKMLSVMLRMWGEPQYGRGTTKSYLTPRDTDAAMGRLRSLGFDPVRVYPTRIYVAWDRRHSLFYEPAMRRAREEIARLEKGNDDDQAS